MFEQDEETVELKETYSTLQQEVELKTKKLKKVNLNSGSRSTKSSTQLHGYFL